ncbi:MAG: hypothetical protein GOV01_01185 [Candidatus Altiarchaeota archaeon]|nr:hypothetical protein [Candidatus Altiarchaeota archaeon]
MQGEINKRLGGVEERVRILESRIEEISNRFESFRMNAIKSQRDHDEKIKTLIRASSELKRRTDESKEILRRMEGKILKTASRSDIKEIEAYLQLISPLDLVTRKELEKMLKKGD